MPRAERKIPAALVLAAVLLPLCVPAIDITVTGNWVFSVGAGDLAGGPGSDLIPEMESASNLITQSVSNALFLNWRVDVSRSGGTWDPNLHLWVRRTNNGTGGLGSVSGGLSYLEITAVATAYITGWWNRSGITHQEKVSGLSVSIPPGTYSSTVVWTVVQTN